MYVYHVSFIVINLYSFIKNAFHAYPETKSWLQCPLFPITRIQLNFVKPLLMHCLKNKHLSVRHNFWATPDQNILNINKFLSFMNCFKREQFVGYFLEDFSRNVGLVGHKSLQKRVSILRTLTSSNGYLTSNST